MMHQCHVCLIPVVAGPGGAADIPVDFGECLASLHLSQRLAVCEHAFVPVHQSNLCRPLRTVRKYLEASGAAAVLDDPRLEIATAEIDGSPDRPRAAVQADLARKESARKALARAHATNQCPPDDLLAAVYSLADHHTYLLYNRDPVERMIEYLEMFFNPRKIEGNWSLAISSGARFCSSCAVSSASLAACGEREGAPVLCEC